MCVNHVNNSRVPGEAVVEEEAEEESRGLKDCDKDLWKGSSCLQCYLRLLESSRHVERRRQAASLED